jgi:hypothetical protein
MQTMMHILAVVAILAVALLVLFIRAHFQAKERDQKYAVKQKDREPLADKDFCLRSGVDPSEEPSITIIRRDLAWFGQCDAPRIYPEDNLGELGLDYDDDVAMLVQKMGLIPGFKEFSFPTEDVNTIADFAKIVLRMKHEAETKAG